MDTTPYHTGEYARYMVIPYAQTMLKTRSVRLNDEQDKFVRAHYMNLSVFVRQKIDELMDTTPRGPSEGQRPGNGDTTEEGEK